MQSRERFPGRALSPVSVGGGPNTCIGSFGSGNVGGFGRGSFQLPLGSKCVVMMEAGRMAAEYLAAQGRLTSPDALRRVWGNGGMQEFRSPVIDGHLPFVDRVPGRLADDIRPRRFDGRYDYSPHRRNSRGKRSFSMYDNRRDHSEWRSGRRGSSYSDSFENEEDGSAGYLRTRRGANDDDGSSVAGVVGERVLSKVEGMGETSWEVDDNGSKASSCSFRKDASEEKAEGENDHVFEVDKESNCRNILLKSCAFAKVSTRPRSSLSRQVTETKRGRAAVTSDSAAAVLEEATDSEVHEVLQDSCVSDQPVCTEDGSNCQKPTVSEDSGNQVMKSDDNKDHIATIDIEVQKKLDLAAEPDANKMVSNQVKVLEEDEEMVEAANELSSGSSEAAERPKDPNLGNSTAESFGTSNMQVDFGLQVSKSEDFTHQQNELPNDNEVHSPGVETVPDISEPLNNVVYPTQENALNHADLLQGILDGCCLSFSDYLGSDMYSSMGGDLHCEIALHVSEGIAVVDDAMYGPLADIGFAGVWDQTSQDYDKLF